MAVKTADTKMRLQITYQILCGICFLQLIYIASVFCISVRLIRKYAAAAAFLRQVEAIPLSGRLVAGGVLLLFPLLVAVMQIHNRTKERPVRVIFFLAGEILICFVLLRLTSFTSNEILLLVAANILTLTRSRRIRSIALVILAAALVLTNYYVIGDYMQVTSFDSYLFLYNASATSVLKSVDALFSTLILSVFIVYTLFLIQDQVTESMMMKEANRELTELNRTLKEMADMREKMGETKERNRLAREIHDTLGHTLTGLSTGIDAARQLMNVSPELAMKQMDLLSSVARDGLKDVRRSVRKLRPDALESHTLKEALESMVTEFRDSTGVMIHYVCHLSSLDFQQDEEEAIYRTVQESMTNSVRHGRATEIYITFARADGNLIIIIEDNGTGCGEIREGFGLHHMKERIALLNGTVRFYSRSGFEVIVEIPLRKDGAQL